MEHLHIFLNILCLMIGMAAIFYSWQMKKMYSYTFLASLTGYLVLLNLVTFDDLLAWYWMTNLLQDPDSYMASFARWNFPVSHILTLVYAYCQIRILLDFRKKNTALSTGLTILITAASISLLMIVYSTLHQNPLSRTFHHIIVGSIYALLVLRFSFFAGTIVIGHQFHEEEYRKLVLSFAYFYFLGFLFSVVFIALNFSNRILLMAPIHIAFNLFPFFWFKVYFLPYHHSRIRDESVKSLIDTRWEKLNISPREKEIAELLLQGLKNQEIEKCLFISPHTVKNHIYNLYKKSGVKSRAQFMRLMMEETLPAD